jgi:Omp85 superfamily domain
VSKFRKLALKLFLIGALLLPAALFAQNEPQDKPADKPLPRWSFTVLPLPSYNDDIGFTYGVRLTTAYYDLDPEGNPYAPYKMEIWGQYLASTKGYEDHAANLDVLDPFGLGFRLKVRAGYSRTLNAQYYGIGNYKDVQRQQDIIAGQVAIGENIPRTRTVLGGYELAEDVDWLDKKFSEEFDLNANVLTGGFDAFLNGSGINPGRRILRERQDKYFNYDRVRPYLETSAEDFFGSTNFKWFVGFRGQRYRINSYYEQRDDGQAEANSKTLIDVEQPFGYDAVLEAKPRYVNGVRVALAYDSRPRSREPNPNSGIFTDIHYEGVGEGTGSDYSFQRVTATWRQYIELFPSFFNDFGDEAIFAYRIIGQETFGDVPFFELGRIYNMNPNEGAEGLGGSGGIRGYPSNQFIDRFMAMSNMEMRYTFGRVEALGGIDFQGFYFYDVGRVAPRMAEFDLHGLHRAWGPGIGLIWQKTTIVTIFLGKSQYESFTAFKLSHMF